MKKLFTLLALGLSLSLGAAHAADAPASPAAAPAAAPAAKTAQQTKMGTCNADAKTKALKGEERKAFMKECLSAKPGAVPVASPAAAAESPAASTQQSKMKTCNVDAKGMKGDERKKFMSECLKK